MNTTTKPAISFIVKYISLFTIVNVLTVFVHELGHALCYIIQRHAVDIHLTRVDTLSGVITLCGESGGLAVNIVLAGVCLYFFMKYKHIVFYSVVMANTVFIRLFMYALRMGKPYADETAVASILNINPYWIVLIVVSIMLVISVAALKEMIKMNERRNVFIVVLCTVLSAILGYALILPLDSAGL